jgi:hypothetical protein
MSFSALNWAWDQHCPNSTAKSVLVYLANRANQATGCCWPAIASIVRDTQFTKVSVRKALRALAGAGLITIEPRGERRTGQLTNMYRLAIGGQEQPPVISDTFPVECEIPTENVTPPQSEDLPPPPATNLIPKPSLQPPLEPKKSRSLRSLRAREKPERDRSEWDAAFREFYAAYPRHKKPDTARRAFFARMREGVPPSEILDGLRRHVFDDRPQFQPYPATWLNGGQWRDEPDDTLDPALRAAGLTAKDMAAGQRSMLLELAGGIAA